jgi:hypothetical protein
MQLAFGIKNDGFSVQWHASGALKLLLTKFAWDLLTHGDDEFLAKHKFNHSPKKLNRTDAVLHPTVVGGLNRCFRVVVVAAVVCRRLVNASSSPGALPGYVALYAAH